MTAIRTNRDLYRAVADLIERHRGKSPPLADYLRALLDSLGALADREALDPDTLLGVLAEAFTPPPTRPEPVPAEDGFKAVRATLLAQIDDLVAMKANRTLENDQRYFGVDAPSGRRWYNFDPPSYLECGVQGAFGGYSGRLTCGERGGRATDTTTAGVSSSTIERCGLPSSASSTRASTERARRTCSRSCSTWVGSSPERADGTSSPSSSGASSRRPAARAGDQVRLRNRVYACRITASACRELRVLMRPPEKALRGSWSSLTSQGPAARLRRGSAAPHGALVLLEVSAAAGLPTSPHRSLQGPTCPCSTSSCQHAGARYVPAPSTRAARSSGSPSESPRRSPGAQSMEGGGGAISSWSSKPVRATDRG
jgi:hypothetical protein